jgi:hypothetical protein
MTIIAVLLALVVGYLIGIHRAYARLDKCERMLDALIGKHKDENNNRTGEQP